MKTEHYILDTKGNPKLEPSLAKWEAWHEEHAGEFIWSDFLKTRRGKLYVETLFHGEIDATGKGGIWQTIINNAKAGTHDTTFFAGSCSEAKASHDKTMRELRERAEKEWQE